MCMFQTKINDTEWAPLNICLGWEQPRRWYYVEPTVDIYVFKLRKKCFYLIYYIDLNVIVAFRNQLDIMPIERSFEYFFD